MCGWLLKQDEQEVKAARRFAPENFLPTGAPNLRSPDRRFSGTGKSSIDKKLDRELRSNARRELRFLVPPRRAGMVAVRAAISVALAYPPDLVAGLSPHALYAPLRRPGMLSLRPWTL